MTRNQLAKRICDNLKLKGMENRKLVKDIIAQEEDIVYEAIATEDSVTYVWGKVYGTFRTPRRLGGAPSQSEAAFRNHGWCSCLRGKPAVKWSEAANLCEEQSAKDFFEEEGHRYTTLARIFRQENGFEEIPEYEGLSEEEILVKC